MKKLFIALIVILGSINFNVTAQVAEGVGEQGVDESVVEAMYNRLKVFETWFRKVIAVVFIVIGIYYIVIIYF